MRRLILFTWLLYIFSASYSQLSGYSYYREIKPVSNTAFYDLKINSAILDRPGSFRVYKAEDTTEVPYILASKFYYDFADRYMRPLQIVDESYESGKYSYATLLIDTNLTYNSVYLHFNSPEYFKDVTVEGSSDNKNWKTITEDEKVFHYYREPGDHYFRNKVSFGTVTFKFLRLKMDDSRTARIDLVSAFLPLTMKQEVQEGEKIPVELKRIEDKKNKQTIIECALKRKYLVTELKTRIENAEGFRRNVSIYLLDNSDPAKENWIAYGGGVLSSSSSNIFYLEHYNSGDRAFKSDKVKLVISNLDNAPLDKIDMDVFTHEETIKVKLENGKDYILAYGKDRDEAPQYDLEYFKNTIPLNLENAELGFEKQIEQKPLEKKEPLLNSKIWIWTALLLCVLIIGIFVMKLMKTEK
jgi:hypothetical protein